MRKLRISERMIIKGWGLKIVNIMGPQRVQGLRLVRIRRLRRVKDRGGVIRIRDVRGRGLKSARSMQLLSVNIWLLE